MYIYYQSLYIAQCELYKCFKYTHKAFTCNFVFFINNLNKVDMEYNYI